MTAARALQRPVVGVRRVVHKGPLVQTRRAGVRWELDLREGIDFAIWLRNCFEPTTVAAYRRLLRPGAVAVDIGANIGAHTLLLADAVGPTGRVVAFEPSAVAFARLGVNLGLNPALAERVSAWQTMLLGSNEAPLPAEVISSWPLLPRRQLHPTMPGRLQPTTGGGHGTLDAALARIGVEAVDLIKLDVDGFEADVLDGASETLSRFRPPVLAELAPFVLDGTGRDISEVIERFSAQGYQLWTLNGARPVGPTDIDELVRRRASMNVMACHPRATRRPLAR